MKSLGQQFESKMMPRLKTEHFKIAAEKSVKQAVENAKDRSLRGEPLPNGRWDNTYGKTQAAKKGRSTPVDLRDTGASMKGMRASKTSRGASVRGSRKLWWHDTGTAKGGKIRQLFPKNMAQVPNEFLTFLKRTVKSILDGRFLNDSD